MITATENFTGAEIEEVVISGLFAAWNDGRREVTTEDLIAAAEAITPMAVGMTDRIEGLRAWAEKSARRANGTAQPKNARPSRVIRR